ncbi:MAG TPA: preprotein translocase subunit SecA, partial [Candidatus Paceibacterota bacterium]|nr:preprotein translocase subunit SecA [Candidatus Paceibacterota bacterium]
MFDAVKNLFAGDPLGALGERVREINALEDEISKLGDEALAAESLKLRERIAEAGRDGGDAKAALDDALPRAFALAREASRRTLGQRPFDVQLMGGMVLHRGAVAEMMTGEGKTLAAVAPTYLNALTGKGAHVVTVNEYLARRDAVWMGRVYRALGLSVACIVPGAAFAYDPEWKVPEDAEKLADQAVDATGSFLVQQDFLRPVSRREAYLADVTYGTNHEFGFDYLRDNLAYRVEDQVQRKHHFAIIDEVDSILIDEARTPLIIAAPDAQSSDFYKAFARIAANLKKDEDYEVDEKRKAVSINDAGVEKVEKMLGVQNIYAPENIRLVHYLEESVKAQALFFRDRDYVVKNGEVVIVDEFTGHLLMGRRYQAGLHQAIEAKEGVTVKEESRTYGKVSVQNYFRMYGKISGMTGTAQTSAEEFHKVYGLEVVSIPPNKGLARKDLNDLIYKSFKAKVDAVVREVAERSRQGQPVLLGTTSISKNEIFSAALSQAGIRHEVLNAKNNEREGAIIAQAGRPGAVTVATNVAGRGVDILLGGNPPTAAEAARVRELGGLHVIGTERHEARRIDNQLRGRAGRQGDPGSSRFFLSVEDDLLRIFGGDRLKGLMERFDLPDDQPVEFGFVSKAVAEAQAKVEGSNFDLRKHLLEYDDVLNKQRAAIYRRRQEFMGMLDKEDIARTIADAALAHFNAALAADFDVRKEEILKIFKEAAIIRETDDPAAETVPDTLTARAAEIAENPLARNQLLGILDMLWMTNLEDLDALQEAVGLRAYGQRDPLVEYRQEASRLFKAFWGNFNAWVFGNIFKTGAGQGAAPGAAAAGISAPRIPDAAAQNPGGEKIGRNDPCPCGSGKKWKK